MFKDGNFSQPSHSRSLLGTRQRQNHTETLDGPGMGLIETLDDRTLVVLFRFIGIWDIANVRAGCRRLHHVPIERYLRFAFEATSRPSSAQSVFLLGLLGPSQPPISDRSHR